MSSSPVVGKTPHSLQSTQQALNLLRDMRQKRKKQNPVTIYELVRSIHALFRNSNSKKGQNHLTISSEDYLGSNRESIEDMLLFIKNKITAFIEAGNISDMNPQTQFQSKGKKLSLQLMQEALTKKQEQVNKITQSLKSSQQQSKAMQIKLLNNMKRLTIQLQQKDTELNQFKRIIQEKEEEFQQLTRLNEKQYKKIRKLEEDLYDAQTQLEQKNQELQAERQCADFLEKKVTKMFEHETQVTHDKDDIKLVKEEPQKERVRNCSQIGIQTQTQQIINQNINEEFYQQQNSQNSSILTQSKQNKYIESIQRLTSELGEAYQRINDLTRQLEDNGECKTVQTIASQHMNIDTGKKGQSKKSEKPKSKSSYFSKFWK